MKKLLIILSILIIGFSSHAQDVVGGRIIAKNSLFVRDRWVDTITVDTSKFLNYNRSIPTAGAVYSFVVERIAAGGGGGGGGTWGSITGTLSNQTDLQNALNLKAPLASPTFTGTVTIPSPFTLGATSVTSTGTQLNYLNAATGTTGTASTNIVYSTSPLFVTPRLASTSTIGYVWTATDASGNGSFQAIPSDNLIVQNAGSGTQTWFTSGDTLYMKKVKNTTFISASTDTDSSLLISLSATGTPSSSTYLRGDNTWATIAAGGDVTKVGTPVNNQIGVWTGDGTIEGDANLTFASSTLGIGVAGSATGILTLSGVTSGIVTIQPASAAGTYTLTLPVDDGTPSQFLQTNGSGVLTWSTPAGSGDVLKVGTPVNNQLGVWTGDGTIEGDANLTFASSTLNIGVAGAATGIFTQSGVTSGTITFQPASAAGTYTLTWPTNDGDADQVLTTNGSGVLSWATASGGSGEIGIIQAATYTLTSTTATQKLFDAVANGEITVAANTTYLFECIFSLTSMSVTSGNCGFDVLGAGTATFTSVSWVSQARDNAFGSPAGPAMMYSETAAQTGNITTASSATSVYATITGIIRVNAGGTIIPSTNLTTAAAAVVSANSYFKLTPIGSGSVTSW